MIEADHGLLSKWNSLVEECVEGTIFHDLNWLRIVEKHTGSKLYPMIAFKGDEIVNVFPLFQQNEFTFLKTVISPHLRSHVPYLGPLFPHFNEYKQDKKDSISRGSHDAFNELIRRMNAKYVEIVFSPGFLDMRPFQWNGYDVIPRYTYMQTLGDVKSVWNGFKKELRKNINNAEKKGVTVSEGTKADVSLICSSVHQRLEEQEQSLDMPYQYFYDLCEVFHPKNLRIFVAEHNKENVGGVIVTCYNRRVSMWFGSVRAELRGLYPNDLLHWSVIKWACEQGFKEFEIVGANSPTISAFKSRYNLDLKLYFSVNKYSPQFLKYARSAYAKTLIPAKNKLFRSRIKPRERARAPTSASEA